jgi:hypothetical protein
MLSEKLRCPPGSQDEIRRWGDGGWMRACIMKHGKFTAWERGRKSLEGEYVNGKLEGKLTVYGESGDVERVEKYVDGGLAKPVSSAPVNAPGAVGSGSARP